MYFEFERKYFAIILLSLIAVSSVTYFLAKDLHSKFEKNFEKTRQQTYYYDIMEDLQ